MLSLNRLSTNCREELKKKKKKLGRVSETRSMKRQLNEYLIRGCKCIKSVRLTKELV